MTTLFTVTINTGSQQQGATRAGELSFIQYAVGRALQLAGTGAGQALSGNIIDQDQTIVGTFTYSPVAAS